MKTFNLKLFVLILLIVTSCQSKPTESEQKIVAPKKPNNAKNNLLENNSASGDYPTLNETKSGFKMVMHVLDSSILDKNTDKKTTDALKLIYAKVGITPGMAENASLDKMKALAKAADEIKEEE